MQSRTIFIFIFALLHQGTARALPQLESTLEGTANLQMGRNRLTITQTTNFASGRWSDFAIATGESVIFQQPNQSAVYLARIDVGAETNINGNLTANGTIVLENGAGIRFGNNAVVNVGGLVAIAGRIQSDNNLNGLNWNNVSGDGAITNEGTVTVMGPTALLAGKVIQNDGTLQANDNLFVMVGTQFTMNIGTMPVQLLVEGEELDAFIQNTGTIEVAQADGSFNIYVYDLEKLTSSIVNLGGAINAKRIAINDRTNSIELVAAGTGAPVDNNPMPPTDGSLPPPLFVAPFVPEQMRDFTRNQTAHEHLVAYTADEMRIPHHYIIKTRTGKKGAKGRKGKKKSELFVHSCHGGNDHFQRIICTPDIRR